MRRPQARSSRAAIPGGPSPYTPALEAVGIPIAWSHHAAHVADGPRPDRLAVTKALTAIAPDHPELLAAAAPGIPVEPWQQVVADAAHGRTLVAVAGTHGKSTTAGWLTWVLAETGLDPSRVRRRAAPGVAARAASPQRPGSGQGAPFVVEADEYAGNFDAYRPDVVALTTIEWDHPDVFADRAAVIDTSRPGSAAFRMPRWSPTSTTRASWSCSARLQAATPPDRRAGRGRLAARRRSQATARRQAPADFVARRANHRRDRRADPDGTVLEVDGPRSDAASSAPARSPATTTRRTPWSRSQRRRRDGP